MRILLTADLQLAENPRDRYRFQFFNWMWKCIKRERVDEVFILGDITEEKDRHGYWLVNEIANHLHQTASVAQRLVILRGNHDAIDPEVPYFHWLRMIPGIIWINNPTNTNDFLFLPHTKDPSDWKRVKGTRYTFAHNTFAGVKAANGFELPGIPLSALPKTERVFAGDIHNPQTIGPVTYTGAPYLCDFGDHYEPRVLILDTDHDKVQSIPVSGPQKRGLEVAAFKDLERQKTNPGDIVNVTVHIKGYQVAKWNEIVVAVRNWGGSRGVEVYAVNPIVDSVTTPLPPRGKTHRDDKALLEDYATIRGLDDKTLEAGVCLLGEDDASALRQSQTE